jgi:hypothetical protein
LQKARLIVRREWIDKAELRARKASMQWNDAFIQALAPKDGKGFETSSALPEEWTSPGGEHVEFDPEPYKGLYEILWVYWRETDDDGAQGIWYAPISGPAKMAAAPARLLPYAHGKYPFVWFQRETLSHRILDSRSTTELAASEQGLLKLFTDLNADAAQIGTIPPLEVPVHAAGLQLTIKPLGRIPMRHKGEISWMTPPPYSRQNDKTCETLERNLNQYFGRMSGRDASPTLNQIHWQLMVDRFLTSLAEVYAHLLGLAQQYMPDHVLERVAAISGEHAAMIRNREEIQGQFDLELHFDVRDLDQEALMKKLELIGTHVLPHDSLSTVQRDRLVQVMMHAIDPALADMTLRPVEAANRAEIEDERLNWVKIVSGIEPEMREEGQNFQVRLAELNRIMQGDPEAAQRLPPRNQQILSARLQHLQFQVQQMENRETGRLGAKPVTDHAAPPPPPPMPEEMPGEMPPNEGGF